MNKKIKYLELTIQNVLLFASILISKVLNYDLQLPCVSFYFLDIYTILHYVVYKEFLKKDTQCHTEQTCLRFSEC